MRSYGLLYRFVRFLVRLFTPAYKLDRPERLTEPAVLLCRHFNTKGIFMTVPWIKGYFRIWALSVYHDRRVCYRHLTEYTLTARFGWSRWRASVVALPVSSFLSALMKSARTIPVYRESIKVLKTYRLSIAALMNDESILIFPEKEYTSESEELNSLYTGFLMIDRLYYREKGQHIPFITLYADKNSRTIHVGEPIYLNDPARDEKRALELIKRQLSGADLCE